MKRITRKRKPVKRWMLEDSNGDFQPGECLYFDRSEARAAIRAYHSEEGDVAYRPVRVEIRVLSK